MKTTEFVHYESKSINMHIHHGLSSSLEYKTEHLLREFRFQLPVRILRRALSIQSELRQYLTYDLNIRAISIVSVSHSKDRSLAFVIHSERSEIYFGHKNS